MEEEKIKAIRGGAEEMWESGKASALEGENYLKLLEDIDNWVKVAPHSFGNAEANKRVCEDWKLLVEIFKEKYSSVKGSFGLALELTRKTLMEVRTNSGLKKDKPQPRLETAHNDVCISALAFVQAVLPLINRDLDAGRVDEKLLGSFHEAWMDLVYEFLASIALKVDNSVACAMLDVVAEMGNNLFCQMPEKDQRSLIVFLLGYANAESTAVSAVRAKFGRCLGKMIEFPYLRDDTGFFMDVFSLIERNITKGENVVKVSFAWTFGNWTDVLTEAYMDADLEKQSREFVHQLLRIALRSTEVPARGRYNACRACGNIFKWLKYDMLQDEETRNYVIKIITALIGKIGCGMDYKLRWNAAHAVGHALENEIFFMTLENEVTIPIIKTLGKWAAQSQNYKERTQCVVSLMKAKDRKMYGSLFPYLWERLCLSVARLPVEDSENVEKFKLEAVLMIFHLCYTTQLEDLESISHVVGGNYEHLKLLVMECMQEIPLERLNEGMAAREKMGLLQPKVTSSQMAATVKNIMEILSEIYEEQDSTNSIHD